MTDSKDKSLLSGLNEEKIKKDVFTPWWTKRG
jgi:hypothetical protein